MPVLKKCRWKNRRLFLFRAKVNQAGEGQKYIYEILMMLLVHQLLCERSSVLYSLLILFFPLVPSVVAADNKRVPHILPKTKLGQPGRSARNLLLQIRKTNSVLVQFRGELAALTRRSDEVPPKSSLYHFAEIVVKMKKCTFLGIKLSIGLL